MLQKLVRNKSVRIVVILLIILEIIILSALLFTNSTDNNEVQIPSPQSKEEISQLQEQTARFEELIMLTLNANEEGLELETIVQVQVFADDERNDSIDRLGAYQLCIQGARENEDTDLQTSCYNSGKALAAEFSDAYYRDSWSTMLDEVNQGLELDNQDEENVVQ